MKWNNEVWFRFVSINELRSHLSPRSRLPLHSHFLALERQQVRVPRRSSSQGGSSVDHRRKHPRQSSRSSPSIEFAQGSLAPPYQHPIQATEQVSLMPTREQREERGDILDTMLHNQTNKYGRSSTQPSCSSHQLIFWR